MTRFHFERPDGLSGNTQNILVPLNEFVPPQGIGGVVIPPTVNGWINDEGKQFVDDLGNRIVFEI